MTQDDLLLPVALVAGAAAGFINTLAGSGSFLTLPALLWLGLPPQVANATNRVGILVASVVALRTFPSDHGLSRRGLLFLTVTSSAGALVGAQIAVDLDPTVMERVIGVLMLVMLALILARPRRFLVDPDQPPIEGGVGAGVAFFAIGVYGGFIQAGVGIFLLAGLVMSVRLPLRRANAVKVLLVLVFTVPAFVLFVLHDQVRWGIGLWMAIGQAAGAYVAARFAGDQPRADVWIRRLLVVVLAATSARLLLF